MSPEDEKFLAETKAATARNASCLERLVAVKLCRIIDSLAAENKQLSSAIESERAFVESILNTKPHDDLVAKLTADRDESHRSHEACKALIRDFQTENERFRAELAETKARLKPYTDAELDRVRDL